MRILHFIESFPKPTETFIKRFVQKSCEFAEVGVMAFNFQEIGEKFTDKVIFFEIGERLYTRKSVEGAIRFVKEKISGNRLWYTQLNQTIKMFQPDVIHCHFGSMGIAFMQFEKKFKTNIAYVTSFYGYDASSLPYTDQQYSNNLNKLWETGTAFFAEGPKLVEKLTALRCPAKKCIINPLLIPIDQYPVKTEYRQSCQPVKFLFAGRFIEKKGFHVFLAAIGKLKHEIEEFSIDVIGAGHYLPVYEQLIATYVLQKNIQWLGMKTHHEVIDSLPEYDFLIHPSLIATDNDSEGGAPTIIIEAQAAGLPIITTDHDDIPFVMGYHDFEARENDVESLMDIIKKAINCNNIEHLAKLGRDKVYAMHDLNINTSYQTNLEKLADL